jgi:hypothetical protein
LRSFGHGFAHSPERCGSLLPSAPAAAQGHFELLRKRKVPRPSALFAFDLVPIAGRVTCEIPFHAPSIGAKEPK